MDTKIALALVLALGAGIAAALQISVNGLMGRVAGVWEANLLTHLTGLITVAAIVFIVMGGGNLAKAMAAPKIAFLGGPLGVIIIASVVIATSRLGMAYGLALMVLAQMVSAGLIDHFGWFGVEKIPFTLPKLLGILALVTGALLMKR